MTCGSVRIRTIVLYDRDVSILYKSVMSGGQAVRPHVNHMHKLTIDSMRGVTGPPARSGGAREGLDGLDHGHRCCVPARS